MPYADRFGVACGVCAICGWRVPSFVRTCLHCKRKYGLHESDDKQWPAWALWLDRYHARQRYYERLASNACWLRFGMLDEKEWEGHIWNPRAHAESIEQEQTAQWLLEGIPEKQRRAITLCILQDYSFADAGREMGCSGIWARVLVKRGLELLRRKIGLV